MTSSSKTPISERDLSRLKIIVFEPHPPTDLDVLDKWEAEAELPLLKDAIKAWQEVILSQKPMIPKHIYDEAEALLATQHGHSHADQLQDGGPIATAKDYLQTVDISNLPESAQEYIRTQLLEDPTATTFDVNNDTFIEVREVIDEINRVKKLQQEAVAQASEAAVVQSIAQEDPAEVIRAQIAASKASVKYLKGKDKKEVKSYLKLLETSLKYLPTEPAVDADNKLSHGGTAENAVGNFIEYKDVKYPTRILIVKKKGDDEVVQITVAGEALQKQFKKSRWKGATKKLDQGIYHYIKDSLLDETDAQIVKLLDLELASAEELANGGAVGSLAKRVEVKKKRNWGPNISEPTNFDIRVNKKLATLLLSQNSPLLENVDIMCKEIRDDGAWASVGKADLAFHQLPSKYKTFELWISGKISKEEVEKKLNEFIEHYKL